MAQVIWTEPALEDLNRIADYIAIRNPEAAASLVKDVMRHVEQLTQHPLSGPVAPEYRGSNQKYRHLVEPPCRIIYRVESDRVWILHIFRGEMLLSKRRVSKRFRSRVK